MREDWPFFVGLGRLLRQDAALARVFGTSDIRGERAAAAAQLRERERLVAAAGSAGPAGAAGFERGPANREREDLSNPGPAAVLSSAAASTGAGVGMAAAQALALSQTADLRRAVLTRLPASAGAAAASPRPPLPLVLHTHALANASFTQSPFAQSPFASPELSFSVAGLAPYTADVAASVAPPAPALPIASPLHLGVAAGAAGARALQALALLLLGSEMDRIVAWHNPLDAREKRLPDEREFSAEAALAAAVSAGAAGDGGSFASGGGGASGDSAGGGSGAGTAAGVAGADSPSVSLGGGGIGIGVALPLPPASPSPFSAGGTDAGAAGTGFPAGVGAGDTPSSDTNAASVSAAGNSSFPAHFSSLETSPWARHVRVAWAVSPQLALHLVTRLRGAREAAAQLQALAQSDPRALVGEAGAARLIITHETVASDAPCLRALTTWAPAPLPLVLDLLARCARGGGGGGGAGSAGAGPSSLPEGPPPLPFPLPPPVPPSSLHFKDSKGQTAAAASTAMLQQLLAAQQAQERSATAAAAAAARATRAEAVPPHAQAHSRPPLFSHPLVAAYAVRSLSRQSPEAVAFCLPQLVQALRHDSAGLLGDFLFSVARRSLALAQQLMWVLASEATPEKGADKSAGAVEGAAGAAKAGAFAEDDKAATKAAAAKAAAATLRASAAAAPGVRPVAATAAQAPMPFPPPPLNPALRHGFQRQLLGADPLPARAQALQARVLGSLSPAARALVELQYAFFDHVTNVSGRLKEEVADKAQRRAKIREFLRDLQAEAERDAYYARDRVLRQVRGAGKGARFRCSSAQAPSPHVPSLLPRPCFLVDSLRRRSARAKPRWRRRRHRRRRRHGRRLGRRQGHRQRLRRPPVWP